MYKITIGGLITIDRIVNDLVITSIDSSSNFETKIDFEIIYKSCDGDKILVSSYIGLAPTYILPFFAGQYNNGIYTVKIKSINGNTSLIGEVTIANYGKLLTQAIREVKLNVCKKCSCTECACSDGNIKCTKFSSILNKLTRYIYSNRPYYTLPNELFVSEINSFLQKVYRLYSCQLNKDDCNNSIGSKITGELTYNEKETKFNILALYLGIYFYHKNNISDLNENELISVNTYFNFPNIKSCIEEYFDIDELEAIYLGDNTGGDYINHVSVLSSNPLSGELGLANTITVSSNIISNDDTITSVSLRQNGSTIYNLLSTVDQGQQNLSITGITINSTFELVLGWIRNGITMDEIKSTNYAAYIPQWYGKSNRLDYESQSYSLVNSELIKVLQNNSTIEISITSSSQYIWFISTNSNAIITNSGFPVSIGDWNSISSFFIKKTIPINLANGSQVTMTLYRSRTVLTFGTQTFKIQ